MKVEGGDAVQQVPMDDPGVLQDLGDHDTYPEAFAADRHLGPGVAADRILEAVEAGHRVVSWIHADGEPPRRRLAVVSDRGRIVGNLGSLGSPRLDSAADAVAVEWADEGRTAGIRLLAETEVFAEVHAARPTLLIVGAGHIARPLCSVGALLGFRVVVADDRPDFATQERFPEAADRVRLDFQDPFREVPLTPGTHLVLVTRGHKYDFECLLRALQSPVRPRYIGLIGSRRRVRATFDKLLAEGLDREQLAGIHAPVGLDVGAETPEEIAVAVAAELVMVRRGGTGGPLRDRERVLERFFSGGFE